MALRVKILLSALLLAALLGSHYAVWHWGQARAEQKTQAACSRQQIAGLTETLSQLQALADRAAEANIALGKTISARQQADATATQEIRHALKTTAHLRVDCVFDDGVMRQLAAARDRANAAAASGFTDAVPAAARTW